MFQFLIYFKNFHCFYLDNGCKTGIRNHKGMTALEITMQKGFIDILKLFATPRHKSRRKFVKLSGLSLKVQVFTKNATITKAFGKGKSQLISQCLMVSSWENTKHWVIHGLFSEQIAQVNVALFEINNLLLLNHIK